MQAPVTGRLPQPGHAPVAAPARRPVSPRGWVTACLAVLLAALATPLGPATAQEPVAQEPAAVEPAPEDPDARLAAWSAELDQADKEIGSQLVTEERLVHWRERLGAIQAGARELAVAAQAKAESVRTLLDALGAPPEDGSEPPAVAEQRRELEQRLETHTGHAKQAELLVARSQALLARLSGARRTRFTERLLSRGPLPLAPHTWADAGVALIDAFERTAHTLGGWVSGEATAGRWRDALPALGGALVVSILLAWPLRAFLLRRFGSDPRNARPGYARRLAAGAVEGLVRGLLPALAAAALYLALWGQGLLVGPMREIVQAVFLATVFFALLAGMARGALAPDNPHWRCIPLADESAVRLERVLVGFAAVFAVDLVLVEIRRTLRFAEAFGVVHDLVFGLLIGGLMLALLRRRLWLRPTTEPPAEADTAMQPYLGTKLRLLLGLVALAIPVSALAGYAMLSRYLAVRVVLTGVLVGVLLWLHGLARELLARALDPGTAAGRRVTKGLALSEAGTQQLRFWLTAGVDALLVMAGVVVLLPLWGMSWADLSTWLYNALFGIQIGNVTFSLTDILVALAVFVVVWTVTRFVQRMLEERILPQTRLDAGVRHSLKAAVGYIGVVLAALMAIAALGLDLSNLAIIAGALSVGIGFGLQAIVNNFVSGLILLVERPVKVGDWVVVGPHEGFVKRINVRATEIETFDRASVVVPNSDLVSSAVINWTHKDRVCRVIVRVPVPYGVDTARVRDILLGCAAEHPHVLALPPAYVLFRGYGDYALNFELRAYARDVDYFLTLESELYFAVDQALREAGIEVPYPQHDVHIREGGGRSLDFGEAREPEPPAHAVPGRDLPAGASDD